MTIGESEANSGVDETLQRVTGYPGRRGGPACDACKVRKCRCDAEPPQISQDGVLSSVPARGCHACKQLRIPCQFKYKVRRRGPAPRYLRELDLAANPHESSDLDLASTSTVDLTIEAQTNSIHADEIPPVHNYDTSFLSADVAESTGPLSQSLATSVTPPRPLEASESQSKPPQTTLFRDSSLLHLYSPPSEIHPSPAGENRFDLVLPGSLRFEIIALFFKYVYPLLPIPHKVTFMADLHDKREEKRGQEEWIALVFSILAFTLVQVPHHLLSISKSEIADLVNRLSREVKVWFMEDHYNPSVERLITMYCIGTVYNNLGRHVQSRGLHGNNVVFCLQLGLNEESTYSKWNPLESEMYRRIFWNVYCSDRSAACTENGNLLFNENEINVDFPKDLDDEFISCSGYGFHPPGHRSLIRGFVDACRLWSLGGRMLSKRMADKARPPRGIALRGRISELNELLQKIEELLINYPEEMRLNTIDVQFLAESDTYMNASPGLLEQLISNSHSDNTSFLVHSAHLHVTQQLLRFMTLQYREDLSQIMYDEQLRDLCTRPLISPVPPKSEESNKQQVLQDLLSILHAIPLEIHAIHSFPGITKIRFISASLLSSLSNEDATAASSDIEGETSLTGGNSRAMNMLCDFLRLMANIERLYSLIPEPDITSGSAELLSFS